MTAFTRNDRVIYHHGILDTDEPATVTGVTKRGVFVQLGDPQDPANQWRDTIRFLTHKQAAASLTKD